MITNSALIVFREGLEAILIIAAIVASLVGDEAAAAQADPARRAARRPRLASRSSSSRSWSSTRSRSTARSSRRWSASSRSACSYSCSTGSSTRSIGPSGSRATANAARSCSPRAPERRLGAPGTILGLYTLGFTSVFREGFETVLFLQALQLSSGTGIVLAGVSLGLRADRGRRRGDLRPRAQAALQAPADRHRRADLARARRPRRQHGADPAGRRLAQHHPDRRRVPALDGDVAGRLPDGREPGRPGAAPSPS